MSDRVRRIAVASGKGGVGKTWLSISLAAVLGRAGRRVLLVDGDLGLANIDVQLGLASRFDIGSVLDDTAGLAEACCRANGTDFDVLAGRAGSASLASLPAASIDRLIGLLASPPDHDVVLLDLGAGIDRIVRRLACWADTLLVVATDEPTSLTDAYVLLKTHLKDRGTATPGRPIDARIVVNQAASAASGEQTFANLARVSETYLGHRPPLAGIVRRCDRVRDAIRAQTASPLRFPLAPSSCDVEALAACLLDP